jgi:diketogulonate reductase-like aldo/keto reductase
MEYFKLSNGLLMPKIGIGTNTFGKVNHEFSGEINFDTTELEYALENGYRLFDTAVAYRNEAVIGKMLKEMDIPRGDLFITSKIPNKKEFIETDELVEKTINSSLNSIGSYIDLYLIHHPWDDLEDILRVWRHLEAHYKKGNFKAIGVSNFNEEQLGYLLKHAEIKPMVNQIESNPAKWNHDMIKYSLNHNVLPQAWGPLDPAPNKQTLTEIGKKYHKSWAQVLLRYQIQRGVQVIPKSHNKERQKENLMIFDFELTLDDIKLIEA